MAKKKSQKESEDSISKLKTIYRKKCDINNVQMNKTFKDKLDIADENGHMKQVRMRIMQLQLVEPIGPVGLRSIVDSFIEVEYTGLKVLRLIKINAEDEGLRVICNFMNKYHSVEELNLQDNGITKLGCEFLGKTLALEESPLTVLKLDDNPLTTEGLRLLSIGLKLNNKIQKLSLKNCQIGCEGGRIIQVILANINSKIENLKLSYNNLGVEGMMEILKVLRFNESVVKFKVRNVGVELVKSSLDEEDEKLVKLWKEVVEENKVIKVWDMRFNPISEKIVEEFIGVVEKNQGIQDFKISELMEVVLKEKLRGVLEGRVGGKKKLGNKNK